MATEMLNKPLKHSQILVISKAVEDPKRLHGYCTCINRSTSWLENEKYSSDTLLVPAPAYFKDLYLEYFAECDSLVGENKLQSPFFQFLLAIDPMLPHSACRH